MSAEVVIAFYLFIIGDEVVHVIDILPAYGWVWRSRRPRPGSPEFFPRIRTKRLLPAGIYTGTVEIVVVIFNFTQPKLPCHMPHTKRKDPEGSLNRLIIFIVALLIAMMVTLYGTYRLGQ
jgi:hypothetical protein